MSRSFLFTFYLSTSLLIGCVPNAEQVYSYDGATMGTTYNVTFGVRPGGIVLSQDDLEYTLYDINQSLSTFIETSLISEINSSRDTSSAHRVDQHFLAVFKTAKEVFEITQGAFNPAVGPLVRAWGFGADEPRNLDSAQVAVLQALSDFAAFYIDYSDGPVLRKRMAEAELDFGAIAKGYAVDEIALLLESMGTVNYLVEIGGEVRAHGRHPEDRTWRIGIEKPLEASRELQAVVELNNASMASSGNYRNYYLRNGQKFVHTINPTTGYPEINSLLSVSVVAADCMTADAYATAFMVMGLKRAMDFVESHGGPATYFISGGEESAFQTTALEGFSELLLPDESEK